MKLNTEMHLLDPLAADLKKAATRNAFGAAVADIGGKDQNAVAMSSDVAGSVQLSKFAEKFPERFFNVGVAEQNLAAVAAGLAYSGKTVFIGAFGIFSPGRNWEQVRTTLCYAKANVKMEGSHTGLNVGEDGATHQALEDLALTRCLPNMAVISPCDYNETYKAVFAVWKKEGPAYVRCTRAAVPAFTTEQTPFELGRMNLLNEGADIAIVASGTCVYESLIAAATLEKEGISAAVANLHTVSHPDSHALEKLARSCGTIITVEEHQVKGGMGSAVCETLAGAYPARVRRLGMQMKFGETGTGTEVLRKYGLEREGIARAAREEVARKK